MNKKFNFVLIIFCLILSSLYFYQRNYDTSYVFNNIEKIDLIEVKDSSLPTDTTINTEVNTEETHINTSNTESLININTADKEQLKTLPNIGDVIAQNIIEYRNSNGLFKNIEEIKNVARIGDKIFEQIKDLITI